MHISLYTPVICSQGKAGILSGIVLGILLLMAPFSQPVYARTAVLKYQYGEGMLVVDTFSSEYDDLFRYYSNRYFGPFVDWRWFKAQAIVESRLITTARSLKGATGVMQLLPSTFEELRQQHGYKGDILDPQVNIAAGMMYDRELFRKWNPIFNGNDRFLLMLASYNAGFYRVYSSYRTVPGVRDWEELRTSLPNETRNYLRRIRALMQPLEEPRETTIASRDIDWMYWPKVSFELAYQSLASAELLTAN